LLEKVTQKYSEAQGISKKMYQWRWFKYNW